MRPNLCLATEFFTFQATIAAHSRRQVYIVHLLQGLTFSQPYHTEKNEA